MHITDHRPRRLRAAAATLLLAVALGAGCSADDSGDGSTAATVAPVARLRAEVVRSTPHDTSAFTQGLVVAGPAAFYESTGMYGRSSLREVARATGAVTRSHQLPAVEFGEGLALVDDRLIQLTWKEGIAHVYDAATFVELATFDYDGEGWGLCYDGERLVMSDGSDELTFRDPDTFAELGSVPVTLDGAAVEELNELECVEGTVYANVYQTDQIVQIDPATGAVIADIDASGLLDEQEAAGADVLNGIAWDPDTDAFYLTGKLWPWVFEVTFVPV